MLGSIPSTKLLQHWHKSNVNKLMKPIRHVCVSLSLSVCVVHCTQNQFRICNQLCFDCLLCDKFTVCFVIVYSRSLCVLCMRMCVRELVYIRIKSKSNGKGNPNLHNVSLIYTMKIAHSKNHKNAQYLHYIHIIYIYYERFIPNFQKCTKVRLRTFCSESYRNKYEIFSELLKIKIWIDFYFLAFPQK